MTRIRFVASLALGLVLAPGALAQVLRLPIGVWRGALECDGGEIPFGLEFFEAGGGRGAVITNGAERIMVPDVHFEGSKVVIDFPHYDSSIRAEISEGSRRLEGAWVKTTRGGGTIEMPFHASQGETRRFFTSAPPEEGVSLAGRWRVEFHESGAAVGEFAAADTPGVVTGTFLTPTGDYRYLEGVLSGREFRLSTFDGSHAFLCTGTIGDDGAITGDFYSGPTFHEVWAAEREPDAPIADGFSAVSWNPEVDPWSLKFTDSSGSEVTLRDLLGDRYGVVLEVMGTWCPNCTDAGRMIEDIRKDMPNASMIRVVSLAFEYTDDRERSLRQIAAYKKRFAVTSDILLGGQAKKENVLAALPGLSSFASFPTTLFITREGRVIAVHSGFAGPATGGAYTDLRAKYERLMRQLTAR